MAERSCRKVPKFARLVLICQVFPSHPATSLAGSIDLNILALRLPLGLGVITFDKRGECMGVMTAEMDLIEELKLRRWARENYVPADKRDRAWHPVVHEEMKKKDQEKPARSAAPVSYWN
jgi:hypothetical protein